MTKQKDVSASDAQAMSDRRKALGAVFTGATGVVLAGVASAGSAQAATISRTDLADAIGFYPVLSQLPPSMVNVGPVPVYWIQEPSPTDSQGLITVSPVTPWFDDQHAYWMVPNGVIGVDYKDSNGNSIQPGEKTVITDTPAKVSIKAVALPGYKLDPNAVSSWNHTFLKIASANIVASDTFIGAAGTAMSAHATDSGFGGNSTAWVKTGGEAFTLDGKNHVLNTSSTGGYSLDTKQQDAHVSYFVGYPNRGANNLNSANGNLITSIGGTQGQQAVGFIHTATTWKAYVMTSSGAKIIDSGTEVMDGNYIIEIIGNQFGYKAPGFDETRYFDVTNVMSSSRGQFFSLFSSDTVPNTLSFGNFQAVDIFSS